MIENIEAMTGEEIEERISQIKTDMDTPGADIDKLTEDFDQLAQRKKELKNNAEKRAALSAKIAEGKEGTTMPNIINTTETEIRYNAASPEYKSAWLKNLAVRDGRRIFGELSEVEQRAYMHTTENSGAVVPTEVMNRIIELVDSDSPILDDAAMSNMVRGFGVPRHKAIEAGDATGVPEGTANEDEQDAFDLLPLDGIEVKKHVVITRKMQFMSVDAFETWLTTHLAARIRVAKERVIIARLDGVAPAGGTAHVEAGIASANKLTGQAYTDAAIRGAFALLKGAGAKVVYANNKTIWANIAGMETEKGDKLFMPNAQVDPVVQGRIYGAEVKVDNNLSDGVAYIGTKGAVLANEFDALTIYSAVEPKTMNTIITAYALFDAGLENPEAFVKVTFTA